MSGSLLPGLWALAGTLVVLVGALAFAFYRAKRTREQRAEKEAEDRKAVLERMEDVQNVPPLEAPPSMKPSPTEHWTRHTPERFTRRQRSGQPSNGQSVD